MSVKTEWVTVLELENTFRFAALLIEFIAESQYFCEYSCVTPKYLCISNSQWWHTFCGDLIMQTFFSSKL